MALFIHFFHVVPPWPGKRLSTPTTCIDPKRKQLVPTIQLIPTIVEAHMIETSYSYELAVRLENKNI